MRFTGAHLLWRYAMPRRFAAPPYRANAEHAIDSYITEVVSHNAGQCYSWNVVNEAIEPQDGRPNGLHNDVLVEKLGPNLRWSLKHEQSPP